MSEIIKYRDDSLLSPALAVEDYTTLLHAILRQAIDDYIKLQHPRYRRKKYLQEAFDNAVDMFFDKEFKMLYLHDDSGGGMSLKTFLVTLMNDDRIDILKIKDHVINEARAFWETKLVNTLYIPDSFVYDGHVYSIVHHDDPDPRIDFETKFIYVNKDSENTDNQESFIQAVLLVVFYHEDITLAGTKTSQIGKAIFKMLRMNSCFIGA
jgi:hypothetical protein